MGAVLNGPRSMLVYVVCVTGDSGGTLSLGNPNFYNGQSNEPFSLEGDTSLSLKVISRPVFYSEGIHCIFQGC